MHLNYNNIESIKQFNACYSRACFHYKRKVRKKNYFRAKRMIVLSNNELRCYLRGKHGIKIWRAKKLMDREKNRLELW